MYDIDKEAVFLSTYCTQVMGYIGGYCAKGQNGLGTWKGNEKEEKEEVEYLGVNISVCNEESFMGQIIWSATIKSTYPNKLNVEET